MDDFEAHRGHLQRVAYRMLGSVAEAEDAVQEAWLRFDRADTDGVGNLGGWLTTVVTRVCLNVLRSRATRREDPLDLVHVPDPIVAVGPEQEVELADAVGLAVLVVLETLPPAERVAFVLHDMFGVPFDEVAAILDRSPAAARQLASRARRRARGGEAPAGGTDGAEQRRVVEAFFAAARAGDIDGLVAVLDPDVVLRADAGPTSPGTALVRGAREVAGRAAMFADPTLELVPASVNGEPGVVVRGADGVVSVLGFTVVDGRIAAVHALADPVRLARLPIRASLGGRAGNPPGPI